MIRLSRCLTVFLCLLFASASPAAVMVFTDRDEWEAAVAGAFVTETFDSLPNSNFQTGINEAGLIEVEIGNDPLMNGIDNGVATGFHVDGTRFLVGNQGFEDDTSVTLRFRDPTTAFAADWSNTTIAANLSIMIAGEIISFADHLEDAGDGFLGFIAERAFDTASFAVDGEAPGGEGFALDNLSVASAVPEPGLLGLLAFGLAGLRWRSLLTDRVAS